MNASLDRLLASRRSYRQALMDCIAIAEANHDGARLAALELDRINFFHRSREATK
jgi:hypothetical protein